MRLVGMQTIDKPWFNRTQAAYTSAMAAGKWNNSYSAVNYKEYWAEGVQAYFSCACSSMPAHTKQQLGAYDPALAGLISLDWPLTQFGLFGQCGTCIGSFCVFGPVLSSPARGSPSLAMAQRRIEVIFVLWDDLKLASGLRTPTAFNGQNYFSK
jgi:hypothetical protein